MFEAPRNLWKGQQTLGNSLTREEVEIYDATYDIVLKVLTFCCGSVDFNVHTVGVQKEDSMRLAAGSMIKVNWMVTVEVRSWGIP